MRRILFVLVTSYLDDSNGAAVESRAMMESLGRQGFIVGCLSGSAFENGRRFDEASLLESSGISRRGSAGWNCDFGHDRTCSWTTLEVRGVPLKLFLGQITPSHSSDPGGVEPFLREFEETLERFRPDVLVNYGGSELSQGIRSAARATGAVVVFPVHNFGYESIAPFATADAVIVPSRFAADHYRKVLGMDCTILSNLIDFGRVRVDSRIPRYVTFVNPSYEKGVFAFARIADELGRIRPDIPLLVVEGRGTEQTLADCGIDLRVHGNVSLMGHTHDPRQFWGLTKICLMPSLWWENQPLVAVEAMANGIPVVASDRGGIPETLGSSGIVLALPDRLTPSTRNLPTAQEISLWVLAIARLWDDSSFYAVQSRKASDEVRRWDPAYLEPRYARFFSEVRASRTQLTERASRADRGAE